jgi:SAM-dependent methyltransferase
MTQLAHFFWKEWVEPGDILIDATCGNGQDLLVLVKLLKGKGQAIGYDIQKEAIDQSHAFLKNQLSQEEFSLVKLRHASHETFEETSAKLIVYNLGYLPRGNKMKTTATDSTLKSVQHACNLIVKGGAVSITCYPGHEEGGREEKALLDYVQKLSPSQWSILYNQWVNRKNSPSLLLLMKQ